MDNTEIASEEKAETMQKQEEQSTPKALTEITAREPNVNNFTYVTSEDGIQVPVPKGYVASTDAEERYVNGVTTDGVREHQGGFVIYEKNANETDQDAIDEIDCDLATAKTSRNQWVWIPISDVTDMYHASGNLIFGNRYTFSASTYTKQTIYSYEPALATSYDNDQNYLNQYLDGINRNEFLQEMREEFYNMLKSVATYGGFYIGRYETGNINQKIPVVRKGNSNISSVQWYLMYKRCKNLKGSNQSVQTGMIWGIQWDETLKWIIDTGDKTYAQVYDSSSWGNHKTWIKKATGYSESWKANNIYDLAGNVYDWSMEAGGSYFRDFRGGCCHGYDECTSPGTRECVFYGFSAYPYNTSDYTGCRSALYIV